MNIYVFNKNLEIIDVIDTYSSVIWTIRYYSAGDFELYLPASDRLVKVLLKDYYLCRDKDIESNGNTTTLKNVMVIANVEITTDVEDNDYLVITGKDLKGLLGRRIVWQQTTITGSVEMGIRQLITENIINPTIPERKIDNFVLSDALGLTDTIEIQYMGDSLDEVIENLCKTYGYGYKIEIINNNFVFSLYVGEDRSYNQTKNPYIVFSPEFENLLNTDYILSYDDYKNAALVAGEGEGINKKTASVGTASGLDRYEKYVDGSSVSNNAGEYGLEAYLRLLESTGNESLLENKLTESFEGSMETNFSFKLNEDYFLGDIVQVINEYGIGATPRILEIIESEDDNGKSIIPTFSTLEV